MCQQEGEVVGLPYSSVCMCVCACVCVVIIHVQSRIYSTSEVHVSKLILYTQLK